MTLVDVSNDDQGEYLCIISAVKNKQLVAISTNSITIEIFSFPSNMYPTCHSTPNINRVNEGTKLVFSCTSETTNPHVELQWSSNNADIPSVMDDIDNEDIISSQITVMIKRAHNGITFVCTMKSSEFPDRQRSCFVGPMAVVSGTNELDNMMITSRGRESSGTQIRDLNQDSDHLSSKECDSLCVPEDTNTVLYLAAGTMGATILMFTFLATTIILCCKYCNISGEVRAVQRSVPVDDGSEPVYVSLQRRPEPDRSSMYMSVEDPNNPGNKVLMPRELVEEFYRSLSLKRKK